MLRVLVIGIGLCWSIAFVAVALGYQLQFYADGAMFSYAVAVRDVWAFHWHNISGRMSVFLLSLWPAEIYVRWSGNPAAGIVVYGLLFYLAPLASLLGTYAADRSPGRIIFVYACASTALLCPLVFGFPTEMWLAHALFWPALAASAIMLKRSVAGIALVFVLLLALAFTHEGALVLVAAIVATLAPRGVRGGLFRRAAIALLIVVAMAAASKIVLPPDEYYAGVLLRAALHFFDPAIFEVGIVVLLFATLAGYLILLLAISRWTPERGIFFCCRHRSCCPRRLLAVVSTTHFMPSSRYYLRTALVILTPTLGAWAALTAISGDGEARFPVSGAAAGDGLGERSRSPAACGGVPAVDAGACGRDRKIRHGVAPLSHCRHCARDRR